MLICCGCATTTKTITLTDYSNPDTPVKSFTSIKKTVKHHSFDNLFEFDKMLYKKEAINDLGGVWGVVLGNVFTCGIPLALDICCAPFLIAYDTFHVSYEKDYYKTKYKLAGRLTDVNGAPIINKDIYCSIGPYRHKMVTDNNGFFTSEESFEEITNSITLNFTNADSKNRYVFSPTQYRYNVEDNISEQQVVAISANGDIQYYNKPFTSNNGEICLEKIDISDLYYKNFYEKNKSIKNVKETTYNANTVKNKTIRDKKYKEIYAECPYCHYKLGNKYYYSCPNCRRVIG